MRENDGLPEAQEKEEGPSPQEILYTRFGVEHIDIDYNRSCHTVTLTFPTAHPSAIKEIKFQFYRNASISGSDKEPLKTIFETLEKLK